MNSKGPIICFWAVLVSQLKDTCWTIPILISIQKIHRWFMLDYEDLHNNNFYVITSLLTVFQCFDQGTGFPYSHRWLLLDRLTGRHKVNRQANNIFLCFGESGQCHVAKHCSAILLAAWGWRENIVYIGTQQSYIILSWTVLLRIWSTNRSLQWNFIVTFSIKVVSIAIT